jgi:hypothetical protein
MAYRVTIIQSKTEFTPEGVDFFNPSEDFKSFFQTWISSGKMTEIQNSISEDGMQKTSIVEFNSIEDHNDFISEFDNKSYVNQRNDYNQTNKISFNRIVELV